MIFISLIAAGVFYILVIVSGAMVVPWQELVAFEQLPAAAAFEAAFASPMLGRIVLIAAVLGAIEEG